MKGLWLAAGILLATTAHAAIYRCMLNGHETFRDTPCESQAKSAVVNLKVDEPGSAATDSSTAPAAGTKATPPAPAHANNGDNHVQALNAWLKRSKLEDQRSDLQQQIDHLKTHKTELQSAEQRALLLAKVRKLNASNNLAGAVYEDSISNEMTATTQNYDTQISATESDINRLQKQLDALDEQLAQSPTTN